MSENWKMFTSKLFDSKSIIRIQETKREGFVEIGDAMHTATCNSVIMIRF